MGFVWFTTTHPPSMPILPVAPVASCRVTPGEVQFLDAQPVLSQRHSAWPILDTLQKNANS